MPKTDELWERIRPKQAEEDSSQFDKFDNLAYTKAWQITREKRREILEQIRRHELDQAYSDLPYEIQEYLRKVCAYLRELLAEITEMDRDFLAVSFLYRFCRENDPWHQITEAGEEETEQVRFLTEQSGTAFSKVFADEKLYGYIADKKSSIWKREYTPDIRDAMFRNEGSALCLKMDLEENGTRYAEGALLISAYGKTFAKADAYCRKYGKTFEHELVYSVLPYFQQVFLTELGMLYVKKNIQNTGGK